MSLFQGNCALRLRLLFFRCLILPLSRLSTANCSAQSSTAEKELSSTSELEGPPKLKVQQDKDRLIMPRSQDFNAWYLDIIMNAELADYSPIRGTMVIRPYSYAIWEAIQEYLNVKFKETGDSNMYFPQLVDRMCGKGCLGCLETLKAERTVRYMWYQSRSAPNFVVDYPRLVACVSADKILRPPTCDKAVGNQVESMIEGFENDGCWGMHYSFLPTA